MLYFNQLLEIFIFIRIFISTNFYFTLFYLKNK